MTKKDLIRQIAKDMSITLAESELYVSTFQSVLIKEIQKDNPLMLQGFGTFWPWKQKERYGKNLYTNKSILIKARTSIKFKPGKLLMKALNGKDKKTV